MTDLPVTTLAAASDSPQLTFGLVLAIIIAIVVLIVIGKSVRIVPQAQTWLVERLGRYSHSFEAGLHLLIPFVDRVRAQVDLREQVVSFPPQPVITSDNLVVSIDTVIYFQVTDPKSAVYEIANYIVGIEQLTVTTLRNVIGSMDLEQTLTSRDQINGQLRGVLDEATGRWGIRVNRVELKAIDPPASVQGSMEQQMRAERDRRAAILTAEGVKQSQILTAEGEKQASILRAEGSAQSRILEAEGEARAILQVFDAIHAGDADPKLLAYQYLQMLPEIANGSSSKLWLVPTEFTAALGAISAGLGGTVPTVPMPPADDAEAAAARRRERLSFESSGLRNPAEALAEARRQAEAATVDATAAGQRSGRPFDPDATRGQQPGVPTQQGSHAAPAAQPYQQPPAQPYQAPVQDGEQPPAPPTPPAPPAI
ncbi:SPFH domain-containing protein [Sanguibacter sp. HDW7]|uniref:SPFH domain-containing protein n=1 Tax=Sanguibacter sp. HDW7 TaxID=2714931 RepID=UPI00140D8660|nr:SPFH domain-containing protein [Sanguibacter sp. HDW7]QIK83404.1 SPFH/Band 7/PHB domain protein [Sanguibacter sp. HDW7]